MTTILDHNTDFVQLHIEKEKIDVRPDLESVTYLDDNGAAHTVIVSKELGFTGPEQILRAVADAHGAQAQALHAWEREHGPVGDEQRAQFNDVFNKRLREISPAGDADRQREAEEAAKREREAQTQRTGGDWS